MQVTHDVHYENFRSQRLSKGGGAHHAANKAAPLSDKDVKDKMLAEKDEELRRMQVSVAQRRAQDFEMGRKVFILSKIIILLIFWVPPLLGFKVHAN